MATPVVDWNELEGPFAQRNELPGAPCSCLFLDDRHVSQAIKFSVLVFSRARGMVRIIHGVRLEVQLLSPEHPSSGALLAAVCTDKSMN